MINTNTNRCAISFLIDFIRPTFREADISSSILNEIFLEVFKCSVFRLSAFLVLYSNVMEKVLFLFVALYIQVVFQCIRHWF